MAALIFICFCRRSSDLNSSNDSAGLRRAKKKQGLKRRLNNCSGDNSESSGDDADPMAGDISSSGDDLDKALSSPREGKLLKRAAAAANHQDQDLIREVEEECLASLGAERKRH